MPKRGRKDNVVKLGDLFIRFILNWLLDFIFVPPIIDAKVVLFTSDYCPQIVVLLRITTYIERCFHVKQKYLQTHPHADFLIFIILRNFCIFFCVCLLNKFTTKHVF